MTTQYYAPDEWHTILAAAAVDLNRTTEILGSSNCKDEIAHMRDIHAIASASKRHNIPLNTDGYTDSECGCWKCGKAMHYTELDALLDDGLTPDTCHRCQCNDECPVCEGSGYVLTGQRILSRDWLDAPEYQTSICDDCGGVGDYDSWVKRKG